MADERESAASYLPALQFHLLGSVDYVACRDLLRRLAASTTPDLGDSMHVLLCEHPPLISVGRLGSRAHIRWTDEELAKKQLAVLWERRGGGCVLHAPGQLAVYPVVPLSRCRWTVGEYLRRLQQAVLQTLTVLKLSVHALAGRHGVWGRTGALAVAGIAVRDGTASGGLWLNVHPDLSDFRFVTVASRTEAAGQGLMGSMAAERHGSISMSHVRSLLIEQLAGTFGQPRYYLHTGHPWLAIRKGTLRGTSRARAS